jgi:hypothetical protein
LRVRPLAGVAAALVLLAAGCGGHSRRHAVAAYVTQVNTIEARLQTPLLEVSRASQAFTKKKANAAAIEKRLTKAAARIDVLRGRLAALDTPVEATKLRALLVELARREADLAREVAQLAAFLPAYSHTLVPLQASGAQLKAVLAKKGRPVEKAAALDSYTATVDGVLVQLRRLHPPPVSRALYTNQVQALTGVRASTSALAQALRDKKRYKQIPVLLHRFNVAAAANQSLAAQRAQIASVRSYDDRIRELDRLAVRVAKEQTRLEHTIR